jgi:hypothetical protein
VVEVYDYFDFRHRFVLRITPLGNEIFFLNRVGVLRSSKTPLLHAFPVLGSFPE